MADRTVPDAPRLGALTHAATGDPAAVGALCGEPFARRFSLEPTCPDCAGAMGWRLDANPERAEMVAALAAVLRRAHPAEGPADAGRVIVLGFMVAAHGLPGGAR